MVYYQWVQKINLYNGKKVMINELEEDYKFILRTVMLTGSSEKNRTGVNCITRFNMNITHNLSGGFMPIITGKKIFYDKAYHEFIWMWSGNTTIDYLNKHNIHWWDQYADEFGNLGKTYGYQLRHYNGEFDQIEYAAREIRAGSRRAHITMWNPTELHETSLPCCYTGFTYVLTEGGKILNLDISFRSSDLFLGLPYDLIVGALFLRHMATMTNKRVGEVSYSLNNAHLYTNHINQATKYLSLPHYDLPDHIDAMKNNYESGPLIEAKLNN